MSTDIITMFYEKAKNRDFNVYGILDKQDKIHTLGTDSKIIGRVFEILTEPILDEIASELECQIETPEAQTLYPDFVLLKNKDDKNKIAIDVKTTYIEDKRNAKAKFTLGSFKSYMVNNTKNIAYPYTDFAKHYVIGFIYKRNGSAQQSLQFQFEDRSKITSPYFDVQYFIQEKYKIAGDKPGSGNTENIGSFSSSNIDDFKQGKGPFASLGQDVYDLYWKYYHEYRASDKKYSSLIDFLEWFPNQSPHPTLAHSYDYDEVIKKLQAYKIALSSKK